MVKAKEGAKWNHVVGKSAIIEATPSPGASQQAQTSPKLKADSPCHKGGQGTIKCPWLHCQGEHPEMPRTCLPAAQKRIISNME